MMIEWLSLIMISYNVIFFNYLFWSGVVVHTCNNNTQEAEARGSGVQSQHELHSKIFHFEPNVVAQTCAPITQEEEAGGTA